MKKFILIILISLILGRTHGQTSLVCYDVVPGTGGSKPANFQIFNNKLYFWTTNLYGNIYYTDGTNPPVAVGTLRTSGITNVHDPMAVLNGKLYYGQNQLNGAELFSYDGINPPTLAHDSLSWQNTPISVHNIVALNGKIYFSANSLNTSYQLWVYNPATNKVRVITDYAGLYAGGPVQFPTIFNNKLYYTNPALIECDPFVDSAKAVPHVNLQSVPQNLTVYNGKLYFKAVDTNSSNKIKLFEYDGLTNAKVISGTYTMYPYPQGRQICAAFGNKIYFAATDGTNGVQLFKYDIALGTSSLVFKINSTGDALPDWFVMYANKLFFCANDSVHGNELWSYDGINNPVRVTDINPGAGNADVQHLTVFNNCLYFMATEPTKGPELYKYYDPAASVTSMPFPGTITTYPNPTTKDINIEISLTKPESLRIRITDIRGIEVYNTGLKNWLTGKNIITIPMQHLAGGTYLYSITGSKSETYGKGSLLKNN